MKISIGYSDSQDRMWLRAGSEGSLWWITRRMCLRMIARWAELLERTSPAAVSAPAAEAAPDGDERRRRALNEHRAALETSNRGGAGDDESLPAPDPGTLVYSVEISANDTRMRLTLLSASHRQAIEMPRADAHRMLAALVARCRHNGWAETPLPAWFRDEGSTRPTKDVVS